MPLSPPNTILDFRYFDFAQYRFWIFDCRNKNRKLACLAPRRKGAKDAKFEARNPKFKTISNDQNMKIPNKLPSDSAFRISIRVLFVSEFVSDFDIQTLDLFRWLVSPSAGLRTSCRTITGQLDSPARARGSELSDQSVLPP